MKISAVTWWLSFVDPDLAPPPEEQVPGGPSFLGVALLTLDAPFMDAVRLAHTLGLNPGGAVKGIPIPTVIVPPECQNVYLSREECVGLDDKLTEYAQAMQTLHEVEHWPTPAHLAEYAETLDLIAPGTTDHLDLTPRSAYGAT